MNQGFNATALQDTWGNHKSERLLQKIYRREQEYRDKLAAKAIKAKFKDEERQEQHVKDWYTANRTNIRNQMAKRREANQAAEQKTGLVTQRPLRTISVDSSSRVDELAKPKSIVKHNIEMCPEFKGLMISRKPTSQSNSSMPSLSYSTSVRELSRRQPDPLEDILCQRDRFDVEESMADLDKFQNRVGTRRALVGSPRIYIEEILNIK